MEVHLSAYKSVNINANTFRSNNCTKCKYFLEDKPDLLKCPADDIAIYECARTSILQRHSFTKETGAEL